jgi:hypothetical protein
VSGANYGFVMGATLLGLKNISIRVDLHRLAPALRATFMPSQAFRDQYARARARALWGLAASVERASRPNIERHELSLRVLSDVRARTRSRHGILVGPG